MTASTTQPLSNSSEKINGYNQTLSGIRQIAKRSETLLRGHHKRVYQALVKTYEMGLELERDETLVMFLTEHFEKSLSNRYLKNIFHDLVTLVFQEAKEDSRSKYRKALKFAKTEGWTKTELDDYFKTGSLSDLYDKALKAEKLDGDGRFEDTQVEKIQRAKDLLAKKPLGSGPIDFPGMA